MMLTHQPNSRSVMISQGFASPFFFLGKKHIDNLGPGPPGKANPNSADEQGHVAINDAVAKDRFDLVTKLLEYGALVPWLRDEKRRCHRGTVCAPYFLM